MRATLARHARHAVARRAALPPCPAHAASTRRRPALSRPVYHYHHHQQPRRTFIGALFREPPRQVRAPEYEPGWMVIMEWRSRMLANVRPPARDVMVEALKQLVWSKSRSQKPFNSTQALQCRRLLEHLHTEFEESPSDSRWHLPTRLTRKMLDVLVNTEPHERTQNHADLGRAICRLWADGNSTEPITEKTQRAVLISVLSGYGAAKDARELLIDSLDAGGAAGPNDKGLDKSTKSNFVTVAKGLAREGRESELVSFVDDAEKFGFPYNSGLQEVLVSFFVQRNRVQEAQSWFTKPTPRDPSPETYRVMASLAMRHGLEEWAMPHFLRLGQDAPSKNRWDVLLQAMLLFGKSLDDVKTMMVHMISNRDGKLLYDIATINGLLGAAVELGDLELAQDVLALAAEPGYSPNSATFVAMMTLHLKLGDIVGSRKYFEEIVMREPWVSEEEAGAARDFVGLLNRYLTALSAQTPTDFGRIVEILRLVDEQQLRLEPLVVSKLCLRFLENDQHFDVMDLLSAHSFQYSEAERDSVQEAFTTFCLDDGTSTSRAWSGYQLLQQFFQDTSPERRTKLMSGFFARKRGDMAALVFKHMRKHHNSSFRPTRDTYIQCLEGLAACPDEDSLAMVYNLLKMDTSVGPSTRLHTAVMLAHTACEKPLTALSHWDAIQHSKEGPSYESLVAVFWTLQQRSRGAKEAKRIWDKMLLLDVDISADVLNAYAEVLACGGSDYQREVRDLIDSMPVLVGSRPDATTLGMVYNAIRTQDVQSSFEAWAKERYEDGWNELSKRRRRRTQNLNCQFKLERQPRA